MEDELVFFWTVCDENKDTYFLRVHCINAFCSGVLYPNPFCISYLLFIVV